MSEVWNYFSKYDANTICNKCNKKLKWRPTHGTSSLIKHLMSHDIIIRPCVDKVLHIQNTIIPLDKIKKSTRNTYNLSLKIINRFAYQKTFILQTLLMN